MATKKIGLNQLATYGYAMLVRLTDADTDLASEVRDAALPLERQRLKAEEFERAKAEIEGNTRFSPDGYKAELGRADDPLEKARELLAEAQQVVPVDALSPAELNTVYARLLERDPL